MGTNVHTSFRRSGVPVAPLGLQCNNFARCACVVGRSRTRGSKNARDAQAPRARASPAASCGCACGLIFACGEWNCLGQQPAATLAHTADTVSKSLVTAESASMQLRAHSTKAHSCAKLNVLRVVVDVIHPLYGNPCAPVVMGFVRRWPANQGARATAKQSRSPGGTTRRGHGRQCWPACPSCHVVYDSRARRALV